MSAKTILIAESGSTKTDWCLIHQGKKTKKNTQGINPFFLQEHEIISILEHELKIKPTTKIDEIHFYGAGISSIDKQKIIERCLNLYFSTKNAKCYSDMLASARATCGTHKGIATILGTGSNTCYFDGKKIAFKTASLGYVLGDEGGGTHLGRKVLQYYLHGIFEKDLMLAFEQKFQKSTEEILDGIYKKSFPNRYLASFAQFIFEQRGHYMIENIAEDCINEVFINHLLRYPKVEKLPVHFTGSVSFFLKDIIKNLCEQYGLQLGQIVQKPIQGLIAFHAN